MHCVGDEIGKYCKGDTENELDCGGWWWFFGDWQGDLGVGKYPDLKLVLEFTCML